MKLCPESELLTSAHLDLLMFDQMLFQEIYKYCTKEQLTNGAPDPDALPSTSTISTTPATTTPDSDVEEVLSESGDPFAGISDSFEQPNVEEPTPVEPVRYRPGPKSKKQKLMIEPPAPPAAASAPPVAPPPWRSEALDDDEVVALSDSDDEMPSPPKKPVSSEAATFDDIFGNSSAAPVAAPAVVFNKDSDDEGEAYDAVTASVAELMGESDDDMFN